MHQVRIGTVPKGGLGKGREWRLPDNGWLGREQAVFSAAGQGSHSLASEGLVCWFMALQKIIVHACTRAALR